ncbi:MAG: 1-acyl-sn-glycerol-3-phosphate acyltransferase [Deltaproteobacteria bacterium]|nr:1-acyl-sn-glycerol-3-phosphate acyltransferase [Deltaproteobacteria bacterium]
MNKVLGYLFTPLFVLLFWSVLLVFHPLLVAAYYIGGYSPHKRVLEWMNFCILWALRVIGTRFDVVFNVSLPRGRPLIVVSNHQSMYDVPLLLLAFRKHHPKFISKVELSRGIPSISFALRHMGSALINRRDPAQALSAIEEFGRTTEKLNHTACIFPEGTRARDGRMKPFKYGGLQTLISNMPNAAIVPVVISGSWQILRYNFWPVPYGIRVKVRVLAVLEHRNRDAKEVCSTVEEMIRSELESLQQSSR